MQNGLKYRMIVRVLYRAFPHLSCMTSYEMSIHAMLCSDPLLSCPGLTNGVSLVFKCKTYTIQQKHVQQKKIVWSAKITKYEIQTITYVHKFKCPVILKYQIPPKTQWSEEEKIGYGFGIARNYWVGSGVGFPSHTACVYVLCVVCVLYKLCVYMYYT